MAKFKSVVGKILLFLVPVFTPVAKWYLTKKGYTITKKDK